MCNIKTCPIFKRYHDECDDDEDDDIFDADIKYFRKTMDLFHCYLFHSDNCGIIIDQKQYNPPKTEYQELKFGGQWYWFFDDGEVKWVPYNRENQMKLNEGWRKNEKEIIIGKYKIKFKRHSANLYPYGEQQDYQKRGSWKRAVIYGVADKDGLLNGIPIENQSL